MSAYAIKKAARVSRLRERSGAQLALAESSHAKARAIGDHIPFGQPILVGHHSERRHRRDIARIDSVMHASIDASKEAARLTRVADAAESNRAISSDDPEAVTLLRAKAQEEERKLLQIKACNAHIRAGRLVEACACLDWMTQSRAIQEIAIWKSLAHKTIPTTNQAASVRSIKARIESLTAKAAQPEAAPIVLDGVRVEESREDNRIRIYFDTKPSEGKRTMLKGYGFRWSPTEGAWQRQITEAARYAARMVTQ